MKGSFVFYTAWGAAIQNMTDAQAGALLKAVIAYQTDKDARPDDAAVGFAFDLIRQKLDEDAASYADVCAQRAESGRRGGMKRAESMKQMLQNSKQNVANEAIATNGKQIVANPSKSKQIQANQAEYEYEYDLKEKKSIEKKRKFVPPTVEEVRAYCAERQNTVDADRFVDYYTANGWKVGKAQMKDWRAAVRTWERSGTKAPPKTNAFTAIRQNVYDFKQLERELVENG